MSILSIKCVNNEKIPERPRGPWKSGCGHPHANLKNETKKEKREKKKEKRTQAKKTRARGEGESRRKRKKERKKEKATVRQATFGSFRLQITGGWFRFQDPQLTQLEVRYLLEATQRKPREGGPVTREARLENARHSAGHWVHLWCALPESERERGSRVERPWRRGRGRDQGWGSL